MPDNSLNVTASKKLDEFVEREHLRSGALHLTALTAADAPDGPLARLRIAIGLPEIDRRCLEVRAEQARELSLALLAWTNGNWATTSELEQERRGQLSLLAGRGGTDG